MSTIDTMIDQHRELVEVAKEHDATYDAFIDDESNWIHEEGDGYQYKTPEIETKHEVLGKLCDQQQKAIHKSHAAFSKFASDYEDNNTKTDRKTDGKIAAFFSEFGD